MALAKLFGFSIGWWEFLINKDRSNSPQRHAWNSIFCPLFARYFWKRCDKLTKAKNFYNVKSQAMSRVFENFRHLAKCCLPFSNPLTPTKYCRRSFDRLQYFLKKCERIWTRRVEKQPEWLFFPPTTKRGRAAREKILSLRPSKSLMTAKLSDFLFL